MGKTTMRDIARAVGVSVVTVSKALAGKSGVGEEKREYIQKIAKDMGYIIPAGMQTREARALDVGIMIPDRFFSADSFYSMLYRLLIRCLSSEGHYGILEMLSEDSEKNLVMPNLILNRRVDALIILGEPERDYIRLIAKQSTPVVFLDFYDEQASADAVVGDSVYGSYRLTSHLIKNGHRDIGFVGSIKATSSIMDRYLGFMKAMLSRDLPVREECLLADRDEHNELIAVTLPEKLPTAFVCNCDIVAKRLIMQLNGMGMLVPDDVSVVGFDDFTVGEACVPALSTFRLDLEAMVHAAVDLAVERANGEIAQNRRVVIGGCPFYRDSERPI